MATWPRLRNGHLDHGHNSSPSDPFHPECELVRGICRRRLFRHHRIPSFPSHRLGSDCSIRKPMLARRAIPRSPVFARSFSKTPAFPLLRSPTFERCLAFNQARVVSRTPVSFSSTSLSSRISSLPPIKKSITTSAAMSADSANTSGGVDLGNYEVLSEFSLEYAPVTVTKYRSKKTGFQVVVGNHKGESVCRLREVVD